MPDQAITASGQTQEEWRPVPGWEGHYEASNRGHIRSTQGRYSGHILSRRPNDKGYLLVSLCWFGQHKTARVHKLVALTFLGPCPEGMEVNHKDRDRGNARATNLEYVTHLQNMRLSALATNGVKLTIEQAREILASPLPVRVLAQRYSVTATHIYGIRRGVAWRHARRVVDAPAQMT